MARVQGGGHSDLMTGNLSGTCFRGYRGNNIVSGSRRMTVAKPKMKKIDSPLEVPGLVARYSADKLVSLVVPPALILTPGEMMEEPGETLLGPPIQLGTVYSWGDQVGRCGTLVQAAAACRPKLFDADENRNNKPYIESDGSNDLLEGSVMGSPISMPFEIWMVADEPDVRAVTTYLMRISDAGTAGIRNMISAGNPYALYLSAYYYGAVRGDVKVKIWRCIFNSGASWLEWNGVMQAIPGNVGAGSFKQCRLFGYTTGSSNCRMKVFDIDIFEGILPPVWQSLLLNWFKQEYNLPA